MAAHFSKREEYEDFSGSPLVLIVEDDSLIRESVRDILNFEGYRTLTASNGRDALEKLTQVGASQPDLILLDLMMPVMDGWTFLEQRQKDQILSAIPVIVISAVGDDKVRSLKTQGFVRKPIDLEDLLKRIRLTTQSH